MNSASLSLNVNTGEAFSIFDNANTTNTSDKRTFRISAGGITSIGTEPNAPNSARLNINVHGTDEALSIYDSYNTQANTDHKTFRIFADGATAIGTEPNMTNLGKLTINVNPSSHDAIQVFNSSSALTNNKVIFKVKPDGTTIIGENRPLSTGVAASAKLSVDGMILAREVRVAISTATHWQFPDYFSRRDII